jgi:hypothetical protein
LVFKLQSYFGGVHRLPRPLFFGALVVCPILAQTSGRISGHVLDRSEAFIPGARITAENAATGQRREAVTDSRGYYSIVDVPIGAYSVKAEQTAFRASKRSEVIVGIAESVRADFQLEPGGPSEVINVAGEVPVESPAGKEFNSLQLLDLPINGRDYARFSLLAPGAVARTNLIADLSFNGLQTVDNQFAIDGVDASRVDQAYVANGLERGARLLTGSLESIDEFRVQTSNYQAQYGRAAGSYVNIATKSGNNQFHGSIFEYFRNDALDARNFFNMEPAPAAELRFNDFGSSFGGPIHKNRTFFFVNYEGSRQRIGITGTGTTPSDLLREDVVTTSPALAPIVSQFPLGTSQTNNPLIDNYTVVRVSDVREDTGSVRLDHYFDENDSLFVRVNVNDSHVFGPLFGINASALGVSDFQNVPIRTTNVAIHHEHIFNSRFLNEFLAGMQRWADQSISDTAYPLVTVTQLTIAPGTRGRSKENNMSYQIGDSMSYTLGAHDLKWGVAAYRVQVDIHSSSISSIAYTSLQNFINNSAAEATFTVGNPGSDMRAYQVGAYVQDTWQVRPGLTVDYGLRYDFETPPYDPAGLAQSFDTRTGTLAPPGTAYFRSNRRDFSPRSAVAWQAAKRLTLRSGYGIFWQDYPVGNGAYSIPLNDIPGNTTLLEQQIPDLGYPLTPFLAEGSHPLPTVAGFNWINRDTYVQQWNVTSEYAITNAAMLDVAYIGNHGLSLQRVLNINLFDPAIGQRPNPNFADINIMGDTGQSIYDALQLSFRQRLWRGLQFDLNYTWAHAIDDVEDAGLFSPEPQDNNDFKAERGNGSGDIRHSVSYDLIYGLPLGRGRSFLGNMKGVADRLISGWQIASLGILHTGVADTVALGTNTFGNGDFINQRPNAVAGVDLYAQPQTVNQWLNPAAFSMPAAGTFGNLGRNTIFGPDLAQIDFSVLKNTPITERTKLQFRAEIFNLANHPNLAQPNTTFGSPSFGEIFNTIGRTLGMGTSRQIQLALRFNF